MSSRDNLLNHLNNNEVYRATFISYLHEKLDEVLSTMILMKETEDMLRSQGKAQLIKELIRTFDKGN